MSLVRKSQVKVLLLCDITIKCHYYGFLVRIPNNVFMKLNKPTLKFILS